MISIKTNYPDNEALSCHVKVHNLGIIFTFLPTSIQEMRKYQASSLSFILKTGSFLIITGTYCPKYESYYF